MGGFVDWTIRSFDDCSCDSNTENLLEEFYENKLNGRDFITIGIFNAIGIVIYMAVAFAMATTVIGGFIASGVSFMVAATVYILMALKVKKKGVFTISGTLLGLIALSGGHLPHAVFAVIGGIICDLIIGNYESKGRMIIDMGHLH